ncbi:GntR family transcriptional regulator [Streptomyces sp. SID12501]|uniref:Winged helix-turn-helix transcriptional regulator n=1 Tax=Streptomyces sp. SID12501 TaxID=2706042 RepID=A0A6B3C727_9ACTN|nr:winged helix-turn-helix domain-containing protein [Streptomyces sp. SID12501]NEC92617.1 winged helix-turn-helix transcriptional regulator [Streptomyces sp. SID12501]
MPINRTGARPLKAQILDELRRRLTTGQYEVGAKFPSLRELTTEFQVAELTVQGAVQELQRAGYLEAVAGRGTFVKAIPEAESSTPPELGTHECDAVDRLRAEMAEIRARLDALERASS